MATTLQYQIGSRTVDPIVGRLAEERWDAEQDAPGFFLSED